MKGANVAPVGERIEGKIYCLSWLLYKIGGQTIRCIHNTIILPQHLQQCSKYAGHGGYFEYCKFHADMS